MKFFVHSVLLVGLSQAKPISEWSWVEEDNTNAWFRPQRHADNSQINKLPMSPVDSALRTKPSLSGLSYNSLQELSQAFQSKQKQADNSQMERLTMNSVDSGLIAKPSISGVSYNSFEELPKASESKQTYFITSKPNTQSSIRKEDIEVISEDSISNVVDNFVYERALGEKQTKAYVPFNSMTLNSLLSSKSSNAIADLPESIPKVRPTIRWWDKPSRRKGSTPKPSKTTTSTYYQDEVPETTTQLKFYYPVKDDSSIEQKTEQVQEDYTETEPVLNDSTTNQYFSTNDNTVQYFSTNKNKEISTNQNKEISTNIRTEISFAAANDKREEIILSNDKTEEIDLTNELDEIFNEESELTNKEEVLADAGANDRPDMDQDKDIESPKSTTTTTAKTTTTTTTPKTTTRPFIITKDTPTTIRYLESFPIKNSLSVGVKNRPALSWMKWLASQSLLKKDKQKESVTSKKKVKDAKRKTPINSGVKLKEGKRTTTARAESLKKIEDEETLISTKQDLLKESATETFVPWSWSDNSLNANTENINARDQDITVTEEDDRDETTDSKMMKNDNLISSGHQGKVMQTNEDHETHNDHNDHEASNDPDDHETKENTFNNEEVDNDYNAKKKISSFYPQMGSWQGFKNVKLSTVKPTTKRAVAKSTTTPKTTTTVEMTTKSAKLSTEKSVTDTTTIATTTSDTTVNMIEDKEENDHNKDDNKEHLHVKLAELLDHNSRLVDIIRATLQIQWTLFSKIISFIIPQ